jgi:hypothetical protein
MRTESYHVKIKTCNFKDFVFGGQLILNVMLIQRGKRVTRTVKIVTLSRFSCFFSFPSSLISLPKNFAAP